MKIKRAIIGEDYLLANAGTAGMSDSQLVVRKDILESDKADDYESIPCICGDEKDDVLLSEVERHGLPYNKLICMKCGLLRVSPRWKQNRYDSFYEHQYRGLYNPVKTSKEEHVKALSKHAYVKEIANWIQNSQKKFGQPGYPRVLEIGAGGGWILQNLPAEWTRTGFDVDDEYLALGKRLFKLEMKYGLLEEASLEIGNNDIIVLSHVVEHFLDPVAALKLICKGMAEKSLLLIEVPGIFRIHRTNLHPMTYMQNAHTFTFCASTLKYVCLMAGLKILAIDETCRAVCVKEFEKVQSRPVTENRNIASFIIDYLIRCDKFYKKYSPLKNVKFLSPVAYLYKRLFIAEMKKDLSKNDVD
ncbi:MAG: methyltransferase domain-containing protein [Chryseolinea sp.]